MGNLVFFTLIYQYLKYEINVAGLDIMENMMTWVSAVAVALVTLWVLFQGYRIVTGQSREPMMALVTNMARIALVVTAATTMSVFGANIHDLFTNKLSAEINQLVTGSDATASESIDENLAYTQAALIAIDDAVRVPTTDVTGAMRRSRALTFATFGTASPPMAAAAMLLLYQFAIALVVGFAPLFILCLIFDQTRELFRKWLLYGVGTLFSMAVLSLVSAIVLKMTLSVAEALWATDFIRSLAGGNSVGLSTQAMEQGGVGLLMTVLIVSVPPMAAMFFNGTMGQFMYYSAFSRAGMPGPRGEPPGAYRFGYAPTMSHQTAMTASGTPVGHNLPATATRGTLPTGSQHVDAIKSASRHDA
jgi:type IV secretion system protein VirB6